MKMKKIILFSLIILTFSLITTNVVLAQFACDGGSVSKCDSGSAPVCDDGKAPVCDSGSAPVCDDESSPVCKTESSLNNPLKVSTASGVIAIVIKAFLGIIGTISLVIFVYAGLVLLTSQGNPTKLKTGRDAMLWAALGILLVFASYTLLKFVFDVVGI